MDLNLFEVKALRLINGLEEKGDLSSIWIKEQIIKTLT
jgi:hypothetical protein